MAVTSRAQSDIQVKHRAWSPSLLPSVMFFTSYCTVLYCTVLYCTVLYCTVLYSPLLFILQKLTCFESLTGRARLHPDTLLSLLRRSRDSLVFLIESRLHARLEKTKKRPILDPGHLDTIETDHCTALCCNTGQNNDEKKSIHIKNRAWSPSLLLPSRIPKIQKQLQEVIFFFI